MKFYKLKRKNEGKNVDIFEIKPKYSVFDYIDDKLKGTTDMGIKSSTDVNTSYKIPNLEEGKEVEKVDVTKTAGDIATINDTVTTDDHTSTKMAHTIEKTKEKKEGENDKVMIDGTKKTLKKKPKKLKKNMHIGRHHRKIFTYKPKLPVDQIHDYVTHECLKDTYILKKDPLQNVFVNVPLFNFYNFYNYFQIDHIEKFNKSKILNLIYYYLYKYRKEKPELESKIYKSVKTNDLISTYYNREVPIDEKNKYENIEKNEMQMKHYLELYINMNNNKYLYMNVDKNFTLKNKIKDPFTISNINKVDSLHIHNYKIVWTIRNVKEKMFWRYREMGNIPLTTSPFSFAGKKLFKLKIWLDGHKSAKKK